MLRQVWGAMLSRLSTRGRRRLERVRAADRPSLTVETLENRWVMATFVFDGVNTATLTFADNDVGDLTGNNLTATGVPAVDLTTLAGLTTLNIVGAAGTETFTFSNPLSIATYSVDAAVETTEVGGNIGSGSESFSVLGGNMQLIAGTTIDVANFTLGTATTINGNGTLLLTADNNISLNTVGNAGTLALFVVTSAAGVTLNGNVSVVNTFELNTPAITLGDDVVINANAIDFDAGATINGPHDLSITTNLSIDTPIIGNTTALGNLTIASKDNITITASIKAASVDLRSGTDGTGDITFKNAGILISADTQSYKAGNGPGGGAGAVIDFLTKAPSFAAADGTGTVASFRIEQDAAITSAKLPALAQFVSGANPTNYTLISRDAGVTINAGEGGAVSAAGGLLLISGKTAVVINDPINRAGGTIQLQSLDTVSQGAGAVLTADVLSARAGNGVNLGVASNVANTVAIQSTNGDVSYKSQGSFTLGQVAASTDYAGAAGLRTGVGNAKIEVVTVGATASQTAAAPITATGGLELLGPGIFQLATANNQVVTIASSATGAGTPQQVIFRDTSGNLEVGTVGGSNGLVATVGIALQSDTGSITQTKSITAPEIGVIAKTGIDLSTVTNNVANEISMKSTASGDIRFKNQNGVQIGSVGTGLGFGGVSGINAPGLFSLEIIDGTADVTQGAGRTITATSAEFLGPTDFLLATEVNAVGSLAAGDGGNGVPLSFSFRNNGNLQIATVDGTAGITSTGTVKLQSDAGNITQSGTGVISAPTLGVRAATGIDLSTATNKITTTIAAQTTAGDIRFKNQAGFDIGTVAAGGGFSGATGLQAAGLVSLEVTTAAETVTQSQAILAVEAELLGAGVTYNLAGNNDVDRLGANTGVLTFNDIDSLQINTVDAGGTPTVGVRTTGATLITASQAIDVNATADAGTTLTLTAGTSIGVANVVTVNSTTGTVLTAGTSITIGDSATVNSINGTALDAGTSITIGASALVNSVNGTTLDADTSITIGANTLVNSVNNTLVTADTTITVAAGVLINSVNATTVSAGTSLSTAATSLINSVAATLVTSGADMTIGGQVNGGTATLNAGNTLVTAATSAVTGNTSAVLTSGTDMNIAGTVTSKTGAASLTAGASLVTSGAVTAATNATLTSTTAMTITGLVTATAGAAALSSGADMIVATTITAGTTATLSSGASLAAAGAIASGAATALASAGAMVMGANITAGTAATLTSGTDMTVTGTITSGNNSNVTLTNGDQLVMAGSTVNAAGQFIQNGQGVVTLNLATINAAQQISFQEAVTVTGNSTLDNDNTNAVNVSLNDGLLVTGATLTINSKNSAQLFDTTELDGGTIAAGTAGVTIVSGGELIGNGTVPTTIVQNKSTLAPGVGAGLGVINVTGNLVLQAGSNLNLTFNGLDAASRDRVVLSAASTATVTGATLNADFSEFVLNVNDRFAIIEVAAGKLTPAFDGLNQNDRIFPNDDGPLGGLVIRYNEPAGGGADIVVQDIIRIRPADFVIPSVPVFFVPVPVQIAAPPVVFTTTFEVQDFGGGSLDLAQLRLRLEISELESIDSDKTVRQLLGSEDEPGVTIRASDLTKTLADVLSRARPGAYLIKIELIDQPREGEDRKSVRIRLQLTLDNQERIVRELVGRLDTIAKVVNFLRTLERAEKDVSQPSLQDLMQHAVPPVDVLVGALPAPVQFLQVGWAAIQSLAVDQPAAPPPAVLSPREAAIEQAFGEEPALEADPESDSLPLAAGLTLPLFAAASLSRSRRKKAGIAAGQA